MKQTKRIFAVLIAVVLLLGIVPLGNIGITASATSKTADEAIAWVKSQEGKALDYDGKYGAQCVDLIMYYYNYLGVSISSGNGKDYATNALPSGWTRTKGGTPQKGDILVYSGSSSNTAGHVAIFESTSVLWHGRWDGVGKVQKTTSYKYNYSGFASPYWGCIHPNFSSGTNDVVPSAPQNVKCDKPYYRADESIHFTWDASAGATDYWVYMWKDGVQVYATSVGNSTSHGAAPMGAGHYTLIVRAGNSAGYSDGPASVSFTIYDAIPGIPTNLTSSQTIYSNEENIHFTWDSVENATDYWVSMWKGDSQIYSTSVGNSNSHGAAPMGAGHYTLFVSAGNIYGYSDTASITFDIYDSAPSVPTNLNSSKELYSNEENINFTWDPVETATDYWVSLWNDDVQIYSTYIGNTTGHSAAPMNAGRYTLFLSAGNAFGYSNVTSVSFEIYDSAPQAPLFDLDKKTLVINEEATLSWTSTPGATEYWVSCWFGSDHIINEPIDGFSKTIQFNQEGEYIITVVAINNKGTTSGDWITFNVIDTSHTHSYTSAITKAATCSASGIEIFTCSCGDSYTKPISINPSNHVNTTNVAATASTCTVKGYTAGVYCNDCKKFISGHEEQPLNASNHINTTNVAATASTCTVKGYTAGVYCNDCKRFISGHETQPLAAHTLTTINQRAASCTAEGYTGDQYCTVCKQTISTGTTIAKKAHTLTTINHRDATYDAEGYTGDQYCTTCQQTISTGTTIPKLVRPEPQPQPSGSCKWCGQNHGGAFGWLVRIFHNLFAAIFGARY